MDCVPMPIVCGADKLYDLFFIYKMHQPSFIAVQVKLVSSLEADYSN